MTCSFLFATTGYYNYDQGYSPTFQGSEDFAGTIVHPQHWPDDLDYTGKKIVVIGSGATAITLIPALVNGGAGHVTMLQRSPSYVGSLPDVDPIAAKANKYLPEKAAHVVNRWKAIIFSTAQYQLARTFPEVHAQDAADHGAASAARGLRRREALRPALQPVGRAAVPGAQRRPVQDHPQGQRRRRHRHHRARSSPRASSSTPATCSTPTSSSPQRVSTCGCSAVRPSAATASPLDLTQSMAYKGMMLSGIPNMAFTIGYTNASWTLKADLVSEFVCRVLNYMDANGFDNVVPAEPSGATSSTADPRLHPRLRASFPGHLAEVGLEGAVEAEAELLLRHADDPPGQGRRRGAALHQTPCARDGLVRQGEKTQTPLIRPE